ncbi:MAG TPA: cysteine dioxygenase family protein [Mycobacteriales bacterium]|nr:cysteine dioxygenase family protein [Mycobacteriales bacterium]
MAITSELSADTHFSADQLAAALERLGERTSRWRSLARFDPSGRWWCRLHTSEQADIWLLSWLAGQSTDLHDHGQSAGAFLVVQGELTEVRAWPDTAQTTTTIVPTGRAVAIAPSTVHDVYNAGPAAAISLHAYSPPLESMSFYAPHPNGQALARVRTVETRGESRRGRRKWAVPA